jgi:beta-glucosidase
MSKHLYLDPLQPLDERVRDLISKMTAEEKIGLLPTRQKAVPRLDVPAYGVGGEGAHGLVVRQMNEQMSSGFATVFPQPIGLSSTWDKSLMRRIGDVIGTECRVYYNGSGRSRYLTLWFPTIDMERDPRWGRTEEAYGEDPFLAGKLSAELIRGAQGGHPFYVKTTCAPKHFYGNNVEKDRISVSTDISERVKREYYLRVFKYAFVEGKALSLMTAYNEINGIPCIVNPEVSIIVKGEWGCEGFIVCDGGDFSQTVTHHKYVETHAESIALALKAGIDIFTDNAELVMEAAAEALEKGLISEADIDRALFNCFKVRFRMGQFDPDEMNPYADISKDRLCCAEHSGVALEAARKSVVLLKNDGILPLDPKTCGRVLVVGDLADVTLPDWYAGRPPQTVTPFEAIRDALPEGRCETLSSHDLCVLFNDAAGGYARVGEDGSVVYDGDMDTRTVFEEHDWGFTSAAYRDVKSGKFLAAAWDGTLKCTSESLWGWFTYELFFRDGGTGRFIPHGNTFRDGMSDDGKAAIDKLLDGIRRETLTDGLSLAADAAARADTVIFVTGNHPLVNGRECFDRPAITFPDRWTKLLKQMRAVNPNIVLTLISGYPYAFPGEEKDARAVLHLSHGEQYLGTAVSDVLFGDYNPAGRLSMTWYLSEDDLPDINDYDIINSPRTYMYFTKPVQYPFGYGLSYTQFTYSGLSAGRDGDGFKISFSVRNTGPRTGDEVAQLYITPGGVPVKAPVRQLAGFERITLMPGEIRTVSFAVPMEEVTLYDNIIPKTVTFSAGASSADIRLKGDITL